MHAGNGADERGLAGAVGAHDGDDGTRFDGQHIIERLRVAVKQVELFYPKHQPKASAPR